MTKETYCNFEISKWLKDKGFDCKASEIYTAGGEALSVRNVKLTNKQLNAINCVVRPTHQMAMAWLREEKNILIYVYPVINLPVKDDNTFHWRWDGKKKIHCAPHIGDKHNYESYEEAVEAALEYTLKHLI